MSRVPRDPAISINMSSTYHALKNKVVKIVYISYYSISRKQENISLPTGVLSASSILARSYKNIILESGVSLTSSSSSEEKLQEQGLR